MPDPRQAQFWTEAEADLWDELNGLLLDTYMSGIDGGINSLPPNIQPLINWDVINNDALKFSRNYRYTWIKGITETTRKQTQEAIGSWIQSGAPLSALENSLEPIYGAKRAESIAATEVTRAFAQGNMDSWESSEVVDGATWMTARDELVCPVCSEHDGETVGIGDIDSAPPNGSHPGCRCYLQPNVSQELIKEKLERIFS